MLSTLGDGVAANAREVGGWDDDLSLRYLVIEAKLALVRRERNPRENA